MGVSRKKPDAKIVPPRPDEVPDAARWDPHMETWCAGDSTDGKRTGEWTFYFAEGGIAGRATYVSGVREGIAEWFHKNKSGDLRERVPYVAGKIHGKRTWQRTRKGKMPDLDWFEKLGDDTWRYEVPVVNGTSHPRWSAHYAHAGMDEQVPATPEGRSVRLGEHMDKLAPQTALMLLEESFIDIEDHEVKAGSLALMAQGAKTARGRYVYMGREGEDVFHLQFQSDDTSTPTEYLIDANELTRAFTVAADYYLTARPVFDTPRKR